MAKDIFNRKQITINPKLLTYFNAKEINLSNLVNGFLESLYRHSNAENFVNYLKTEIFPKLEDDIGRSLTDAEKSVYLKIHQSREIELFLKYRSEWLEKVEEYDELSLAMKLLIRGARDLNYDKFNIMMRYDRELQIISKHNPKFDLDKALDIYKRVEYSSSAFEITANTGERVMQIME